jgi:catechol 2,3-dioxygenase-like lactoylglutathione lyase family enzyme
MLMAARQLLAGRIQTAGPPLPVLRLHGLGIRVSDPSRTLDFYQELFGMPVQARGRETVTLRVGNGPQFMAVSPTVGGEQPSISHICLSVPEFDVDALLASLSDLGITRIDPPAVGSRGIEHPMNAWVRMTSQGTPEVYFADARGLVMQLQDATYCGGGGPLGNVCQPQRPQAAGEIALGDINHFTVFVSDGPGAINFYQTAMGFAPQAYQAATPALGVGDGVQFLMFAGGGGRGGGAAPAPTPANIHHASFNMDGFDPDEVLQTLTGHGLSASTRNTGPLVHYISLRMPNRGGAEGGTPELYFTDPDGLLMQIQDSSYCGGGGVLGNICQPVGDTGI